MAFIGQSLSGSIGPLLIQSGSGTGGQVLILSGGGGESYDESTYTDINFFVSGSVGKKDSQIMGVSLFGGDLHISGNLTVDGTSPEPPPPPPPPDVGWFGIADGIIFTTGSLNIGTAGDGTNPDIKFFDGGSATFNKQGTVGAFVVTSPDIPGSILVDGSTNQLFLHSSGTTATEAGGQDHPAGTDVATYISGTVGSVGVSMSKGATLITGDTVLSGTVQMQDGKSLVFNGSTNTAKITNNGSNLDINAPSLLNLNVGSSVAIGEHSIGTDIILSVSGALGGKASRRGVSLFAGDTFISGTLIVSGAQRPGNGYSGGSISGSIHHTSLGLSYLAAGSNVTITSASNGQVTIDSSGGGGGISWYGSTANGVATFKDADEATVEANLTFDGTNLLIKDQGQIQFLNGDQSISNAGTDLSILSSEGVAIAADGGVLNLQGSNQIKLTTSGGPVLILTGVGASTAMSPDESNYSDLIFFVSGSAGSKDTANPGVSLFGGDLVVSGNTYLAMKKSGPGSDLVGVGTDTNFFVSGTVGSYGTSNKGTALFGGDVVMSGSLYGGDYSQHPQKPGTRLTIKSSVTINAALFEFTGNEDEGPDAGRDASFLISGTMDGKQSGGGVAVFGGDTVISGTLYGGVIDYGEGEIEEKLTIGTALEIAGSRFFFDGDDHENEEAAAPDGDDIVFSVSGSIGGKGQDAFEGDGGVAAFGGDMVVSGSIYVSPEDTGEGFVLISPSGKLFRINVADNGDLSTTDITP